VTQVRGADWTLVHWKGEWWLALNQDGEIFAMGHWGMCKDNVGYWRLHGLPRGAAYGEHGPGYRGPLP
jgi:hypothetical protein